MLEAFNYMFKDGKYIEKAGIYAGLVFFANLFLNFSQSMRGSGLSLLLLMLGYVAMFIPSGYGVACIKAIMTQNENIILPVINIKKNFILGFKLFIAGVLLGLAIGGICVVFCIAFGIIGAIVLPNNIDPRILGLLFLIPFLILSLAILLLYVIYGLAMGAIFAKKEYYTTFFKFGLANKLIANKPGKYFSALGVYVLAFIILIIINVVPSMVLTKFGNSGTVMFSAIQAIISAYITFVFAYITARAIHPEVLDEEI